MDAIALQTYLVPWLRVSTWHTRHPKDEERFHKALNAIFSGLGYSITFEHFYDAIHSVLAELEAGDELYRTQSIEKFARRAEVIGSYLFDVRNAAVA